MQTELLTIPELCRQVNIGKTYAYRLIGEGTIKAVKCGRKTLVPRAEIHKWIETLKPYAPDKQEA